MADEDPIRLNWIRWQRCAATGEHFGPVHAHHAGERPGMARKAPDDTCVPLCQKHHAEWHGACGVFRHLDRDQRRTWADEQIERARKAYDGWRASASWA